LLAPQRERDGIGERAHGGRARLAIEEADLAEHRALLDLGEAAPPGARGVHHLDASFRVHVERLVVLARAHHRRARGESLAAHVAEKLVPVLAAQLAEDDEVVRPRARRLARIIEKHGSPSPDRRDGASYSEHGRIIEWPLRAPRGRAASTA